MVFVSHKENDTVCRVKTIELSCQPCTLESVHSTAFHELLFLVNTALEFMLYVVCYTFSC